MLTLHRSERADALVRELATVLADVPADPFVPDVVAVPSKGVERWIAQSLSAHLGTDPGRADGICANVEFPTPRRIVGESLAAAAGVDPDDDPWVTHRLTWTLLDVIDHCSTEAWCATLGRHLGTADGLDHGRRVAVAQKLAGLFTAYGAQRPTMVQAWARGADTDGYGTPLDEDLVWQAELWRRLRTAVGSAAPAERLDDACDRLRGEPALADLPDRVSFFGPTRLTTEQLAVLDALATRRDVHLWLPHPSHGLWDRLAGTRSDHRTRRDDPTLSTPRHPLVRSMARDARELQLRLTDTLEATADTHVPTASPPDTLLGRLQRDIHDDTAPEGTHALTSDDRSVQVHACHGRHRQVEVLREVLLGLLDDDPTLEARDVIVMCPDIEAWAPLLTAAFGLADDETDGAHPGHRLRVRLADRSLRQTNPVLTVLARLLDLVDGRMTASDLLDLAAMPPVRRRFGFDDDALERLGDWIRTSGVRWGLDADGRAPYGLDGFGQNTWRAGLDRILVGVAMDEDDLRPVGLALPLDDIDSSEIDLAGRLAEYVDRVASLTDRLTVHQPLAAWADALVDAVELLTDTALDEQWQHPHAHRQLTDVLTSAGDLAATTSLGLSDVRALLGRRLEGRPTRANFRTGNLTMCTMVPMRSVPHRVVCLLGLDDGVFPRGSRIDGDDVLARAPRIGERDPRAEDRQLFLDAVLAAQDHLVVLHTGADERTGAERPPAVPVGELLDTLDHTAAAQDGTVRDHVVVRHPLQPFDPRNFEDGTLGTTGPFSFDAASYDGARAASGERAARGPFLAGPLPPPPPGDVELDDLVRFLEHPAKAFLQQRLGMSELWEEDEPEDDLPIALDPLQQWSVGDRMLQARVDGTPGDAVSAAEWLRGGLPPGALGSAALAPVESRVEALVSFAATLRPDTARTVDVSIDLADGRRLVGGVASVHDHDVVRVVYSNLGTKHRLRAWVHYLALAAGRPGEQWTATTVGRRKDGVRVSRITGVAPADARNRLGELVALLRDGMCAPLPLTAKASAAYADRRNRGVEPPNSAALASREWRGAMRDREFGEYDDPAHLRVWGDVTLDALMTQPPDPAETGWPDEPHRFGQLARRVWEPLLIAETVTDA